METLNTNRYLRLIHRSHPPQKYRFIFILVLLRRTFVVFSTSANGLLEGWGNYMYKELRNARVVVTNFGLEWSSAVRECLSGRKNMREGR